MLGRLRNSRRCTAEPEPARLQGFLGPVGPMAPTRTTGAPVLARLLRRPPLPTYERPSNADAAAPVMSEAHQRARGGRPPALDADAHAAVRAMHDAGAHTIDELAAAYNVPRPTTREDPDAGRAVRRGRPAGRPRCVRRAVIASIHPVQLCRSQYLRHSAPSLPRMYTSRCFGPELTTVGEEPSTAPSSWRFHPVQALPVQAFCHSALSMPRA